jgi:hypothetical protein
MERRKQALGH